MIDILRKVCKEYSDEEVNYEELINQIYERVKKCEVDFTQHLSHKEIYQNKKKRSIVWFKEKCDEELLIKYLKKRLDSEFEIKYPNRRSIMKDFFDLCETLPKMSDFTIFKFDFKDFFNSLNSERIYEKYFDETNLYRYEKEILKKLFSDYKKCFAGIATSNALVELISRDFDSRIESMLFEEGLIFYSRFVDDGLLVFNCYKAEDELRETINNIIDSVFNRHNVQINEKKSKYISRSRNMLKPFSYLGYQFNYDKNKNHFVYGISDSKINKHKKRFKLIINEYKEDNNMMLFKERYFFIASRVVFYNNFSSHESKVGNWEVIGICDSYSELRYFLRNKERITKNTREFLRIGFTKLCYQELGKCPYFAVVGSNSCIESNNNLLINRMYNNKSIVFHPHIGWSTKYLVEKIESLTNRKIFQKVSYRELVKRYCGVINVEEAN